MRLCSVNFRNRRSGWLAARVTSAFDNLVGPDKPLKGEAPDATEFAGLICSVLTKANAMSPI